MGEVDHHLASKLLKQAGIEDEQQLDQEIQLLQDRVTKTRQKMAASAAAAANPGEVADLIWLAPCWNIPELELIGWSKTRLIVLEGNEGATFVLTWLELRLQSVFFFVDASWC